MAAESKTINEYVERFFEAEVGNPWDCVAELRSLFGLDTVEAYSYVSKYLSKKWEVNKNDG